MARALSRIGFMQDATSKAILPMVTRPIVCQWTAPMRHVIAGNAKHDKHRQVFEQQYATCSVIGSCLPVVHLSTQWYVNDPASTNGTANAKGKNTCELRVPSKQVRAGPREGKLANGHSDAYNT